MIFYTSVAKELKLKVNFGGRNHREKKLVGGSRGGGLYILNRVKASNDPMKRCLPLAKSKGLLRVKA